MTGSDRHEADPATHRNYLGGLGRRVRVMNRLDPPQAGEGFPRKPPRRPVGVGLPTAKKPEVARKESRPKAASQFNPICAQGLHPLAGIA